MRVLRPGVRHLPARLNQALGRWWEPKFWGRWLRGQGLDTAPDFQRRLDPTAELGEPLIVDRAPSLPVDFSILDVGAGPLTSLGKTLHGHRIRITAIDPLGDVYAKLLAANGLVAPVPTETWSGERLRERFGENSFDVVYANNALDHAEDPVSIIGNMLGVAKPTGFVALRHQHREGERRGYTLLHQWNFDLEDGRASVWNRQTHIDLTERFGTSAHIEAFRDGESVCVVLRPGRGSRRSDTPR